MEKKKLLNLVENMKQFHGQMKCAYYMNSMLNEKG